MDQAQLLSLIGSLYDKLVSDVALRVTQTIVKSDALKMKVDRLVKDQTDIDRELVTQWIKDELDDVLDDKVTELISNNFDINDYADNLDIEDRISDYMDSHLTDRVRDEVRDMTFTVSVD